MPTRWYFEISSDGSRRNRKRERLRDRCFGRLDPAHLFLPTHVHPMPPPMTPRQ